MSTYWGYKCMDCDVHSDEWFNHGEQKLQECVEFYHIARLLGWQYAGLSDLIGDSVYAGEVSEFLQSHADHDIVLHNEYGGIDSLTVRRVELVNKEQ